MSIFVAFLLYVQPAAAAVGVLPITPGVQRTLALPVISLGSPAQAVGAAASLPIAALSPVTPALAVQPPVVPARAAAVPASLAIPAQAVTPRFSAAASASAAAGKALAAPLAAPSGAAFNAVFDGARRTDDPALRSNFRFVKGVLGPAVTTAYPMKVRGSENVPKKGGVLLIGNHPSYFDPVLAAMVVDRPVHFLMYKAYYEGPFKGWLGFLNPVLKAFLKRMGVIPVAPLEPGNGPKGILRTLKEAREALLRGEVVALFPEGHVSRDGSVDRFLRGFAFIARGTGAAVVPFGLRGPWGSLLSFGPKRSWLSRLFVRRSMTVTFGPALQTHDPAAARDAVIALTK